MTGRTHDLAAITALGAIVIFEPLQAMTLSTVITSVFANQIGGIAPDIDQPTAPLWHNLPAGKLFGVAFDKSMGGHRFFTHSILGLGLFGVLAHFLLVFIHPLMPHVNIGLVWWSFLVGMFSHLVMDSFTKEGVPWLLPIPTRFGFPPTKSLRITTGGAIEMFVVFPGLLLIDVWLIISHYNKLLLLIHQYIR